MTKMDLIEKTLEELRSLGVDGTLVDIVVTRAEIGPWTLTYVEYDDSTMGCGIANNERDIPDDTSFLRDLIGLNSYKAIERLEDREEDVFVRSLKVSIASALSHRLMNDEKVLREAGYKVSSCFAPNVSLMDPSKIVKNRDIVVTVGFHVMLTPFIAPIAKELYVTELKDLKELEVIDFKTSGSNLRIVPASKNKEILQKADVVYITGETIVNSTIGEILDYSENARTRIIYGPTSSFYPKVLFDEGIDFSLAIVLPSSLQFREQFVLSRGWWQGIRGVKMILINKGGESK